MADSGKIAFPRLAPRTDVVTAALVPADRYSKSPVTSGVTARLWDAERDRELPTRMVRNLSGQLILLNSKLDEDYLFRVDPTDAGYSGPFDVPFRPTSDNRQLVVWLRPRPDAAFERGTTLIRGVVIRNGVESVPAAGADLSVTIDGIQDDPFEAATNARGNFALPVRLPLLAPGEEPEPVSVSVRIKKAAAPSRLFQVELERGREHIFKEPIDLDGDTVPPFVKQGEPHA